jgi:hypothetical protein
MTANDFSRPKRRGGGGKLSRSETVTVRLDPKLRYLAELGSRKQRRTLSSFIEWAVERVTRGDEGTPEIVKAEGVTPKGLLVELWDVDEADRFVKLATCHPELLSYSEQVLWKLIKEAENLWDGPIDASGNWTYDTDDILSFKFAALREHWDTFKAVARGQADKSALPDRMDFPLRPANR